MDVQGCSCPSLTSRYLNLYGATARESHMASMLQASIARAGRCSSSFYGPTRLEAIKPSCLRGQPCHFNSSLSPWSKEHVYKKLEKAHTRKFSDGRRAGSLGNWLSHVSAWQRFSDESNGAEYLLLLEDDAAIHPDFFASLPCQIRRLQRLERGSWHVVRFSTWGSRHDSDRLDEHDTTSTMAPSMIYTARAHAYDSKNWTSFAYGGTHAILLQRSTVASLLAYVLANGAMGTDVALRERTSSSGGGNGRTSERPLRSFVMFTPLVGVGRQQFDGWRSLLKPGAAGLQREPG